MALATWTVEEVQSGHIRPWHGLIANIPAGWQICDGTNGTPDLRGVYPKGAPAGQEAGATGGNLTHTHADHPALVHSGAGVNDHTNVGVPGTATSSVKMGTSASNAAAQTHTHTISTITHTVTQPSQHAAQSHDSPNHEPPYRTVVWIMKL